MDNIVRSAAGADLQTHQLTGKPMVTQPNSSLNQKFNIQPNTVLADTDIVSMQYVTIGCGGHAFLTDASGTPYPEPIQHQPTHAGLYKHLPFVLRLPNADLTDTERLRYRLRRLEQHNGVTYVAYYAMMLDLTETSPALELRTVQDGVVTSTPFSYTLDNLNPTAPTVTAGSTWTTGGDYTASTAKVNFSLSTTDIAELLNVANVIFGNDNLAIVSEIGLSHGVDRPVTGDFNGVSQTYTEVIGCQITNFVSAFISAKFTNSVYNLALDVGSVESMLVLSQS